MAERRRNIAVILAGGVGERMGADLPKQFIKVAGLPVIEHTLKLFQDCTVVDEVIVMVHAGSLERVRPHMERYSKVSRVLVGGGTRNETTRLALAAIPETNCNVLFHDAVRPLLDSDIIERCVVALKTHQAVDVAIPSADTIIRVAGNTIADIPDRSTLMRGQTPQGFQIATIRRAYELAADDPHFLATDDCGVVLKYLPEVPIAVVKGSERNVKVTHPIDLHIVDKLFQLATVKQAKLTAAQLRRHLKGKTVVVFGGSYGIGEAIVRLAEAHGARVLSFSRSSTQTHIDSAEDIAQALRQARQTTGGIDYIVNTAGVLQMGGLESLSEAEVQQIINVNFVGPALLARAAMPYLRETKGHLLLFTSSSYTRGRAQYSLYSSSKAAVVNLTQALAEEWSVHGVRINCINPERTATPMRKNAFGDEDPTTLLTSEMVAQKTLGALVSDMTGQVFDVRLADV